MNFGHGLNASPGHLHVDDHHVRTEIVAKGDGIIRGFPFADHLEVVFKHQGSPRTVAEDWMIIDHANADLACVHLQPHSFLSPGSPGFRSRSEGRGAAGCRTLHHGGPAPTFHPAARSCRQTLGESLTKAAHPSRQPLRGQLQIAGSGRAINREVQRAEISADILYVDGNKSFPVQHLRHRYLSVVRGLTRPLAEPWPNPLTETNPIL
jgi:hypothetical protein